jgi:hypothetical protein
MADVEHADSSAEARLLEQVMALADQLQDHEQREHAFAVAVLEKS